MIYEHSYLAMSLKFEKSQRRSTTSRNLFLVGQKPCLEELLNCFAKKVPKHKVQWYCRSNTRFHNLLRVSTTKIHLEYKNSGSISFNPINALRLKEN